MTSLYQGSEEYFTAKEEYEVNTLKIGKLKVLEFKRGFNI